MQGLLGYKVREIFMIFSKTFRYSLMDRKSKKTYKLINDNCVLINIFTSFSEYFRHLPGVIFSMRLIKGACTSSPMPGLLRKHVIIGSFVPLIFTKSGGMCYAMFLSNNCWKNWRFIKTREQVS